MGRYGLPLLLLGGLGLAGVNMLEDWQAGERSTRKRELDRRFARLKDYSLQADDLTEALIEGKYTLVEAARELTSIRARTGHDCVPYLRVFHRLDDVEACLAAQLAQRVGFMVSTNPEAARRHLKSLQQQFTVYSPRLPPMVRTAFGVAE